MTNIRYSRYGVTFTLSITINAPQATASGAGNVPDEIFSLPMYPRQVTATAAALAPTLVAGVTIDVPQATATGQGLNEIAIQGTTTGSGSSGGGAGAGSGGDVGGARATRNLNRELLRAVGGLQHMVIAPTGEVDYPIVGDWEAEEQIPGGFWTATGVISKQTRRTNLHVYTVGSKWWTYNVEDGQLVWRGKITEIEDEEGMLRLTATAAGKRMSERNIHKRLLYQIYDMSEWKELAVGSPFNRDHEMTLDTELEQRSQSVWTTQIDDALTFIRNRAPLESHVGGDPNQGVDNASDSTSATWFSIDLAPPGLTRMAFRLHVFSPDDGGSADTAYQRAPYPISLNIVVGRYDEEKPQIAQGTFSDSAGFGGTVRHVPDPLGVAVISDVGENYDWHQFWDVSFYYAHHASGYTSTGGASYAPSPHAYSDRDAASHDSAKFMAINAGREVSDAFEDSRHTWDNRPFERYPTIGPQHPRSTNYADPNATTPLELPNTAGNVREDEFYPLNWISVYWSDAGPPDIERPSAKAAMHDVRINGIAPGDHFSASDLMKDVAMRLGMKTTRIGHAGVNILPYDAKDGTWADIMDHAALLSNHIWRIVVRDVYRSLEFYDWHDAPVWTVIDPEIKHNFRPLQQYTGVTIPYKYPGKNDVTATVYVRWTDVPPGVNMDYGTLQLDQPMPTRHLAEHLGHLLLRVLHRKRMAGDITISQVISPTGIRESAYNVHAGDVIDHQRTRKRHMRIASVRKTYEGVDVTFAEDHPVVDAMVARQNLRFSRPSPGRH